MAKAASPDIASTLNREFLKEYTAEENVRRYRKETAGDGISYLLDHDYGEIYLNAIDNFIPEARRRDGIRLWEFGCGAGMNLIHLVSLLKRRGIRVQSAYGTDFSEKLIDAANRDAEKHLGREDAERVRFCVARNQNLIGDVMTASGTRRDALAGSFDLVFGVNTMRYCHRLMNENECAADVADLLTDGGVCIVIDMNDRFPAFRSRLRDRLTMDAKARYLPSLDEYARPFSSAGFEILEKKNFCWIPHSANPRLLTACRTAAPILNLVASPFAMRSLVVGRKSANAK